MPIDSSPEALAGKARRIAKRSIEVGISSGLREHITQAAQKIRGDHSAELADVLKADCAGRLFKSLIRHNGKPAGSLKERSGIAGEGVGTVADELGAWMDDVIRAGTGLLEEPVTVLAQAWVAALTRLAAKVNLGTSAEGPKPEEASQPQPAAAPQVLSTAVGTAVPCGQAPEAQVPETPAASPRKRCYGRFSGSSCPCC